MPAHPARQHHRHRRSMIPTALAMLALLLVGLAGSARAAAPEVLGLVPQGAAMFAFAGDVGKADQGIKQMAQALGEAEPEDQSLLDMMFEEMGVKAGFNRKGGMAIVLPQFNPMGFMNPQGAQAPQFLVIVPVSDYAAFTGNFKALPAEPAPDGVSAFNIQGDTAFIKQQGSYAVMSNSSALLGMYKPGNDAAGYMKKAGALGAQAIADGDMAIYFDWMQVGPILQPLVAMGLMGAQQAIAEQPVNAAMPGGIEAQQAMIKIYATAITAYIRDTQALMLVGNLTGDGAGLSIVSQFKPGSPSATTMSGKPSGKLGFDRLPNQPYLMAMAFDNQAFPWDAITKMLNKDMIATLPEGSPLTGLLKSYSKGIDAMAISRQVQFAWYETPGVKQDEVPMDLAYVYTTDQPGKLRQVFKQYALEVNTAMLAMMKQQGQQESPMVMGYTSDAATIAGQKVDRMTFNMNFPDDVKQQAKNDPGAAMVLGMMGQGFQGYVGQSNDAVLYTMSNRDNKPLMATLIGVSGAASNLEQQADLKKCRAALPPHRIVEGYMRLGDFINAFAKSFAPDEQINMPKGTPPMAFSLSSKDSGLNFHMHMPTATIKAIAEIESAGPGPVEPQPRPIRVRPE